MKKLMYYVIQMRKLIWKSNHLEEGYSHGKLVLTSEFADERWTITSGQAEGSLIMHIISTEMMKWDEIHNEGYNSQKYVGRK